MPEAFFVGVGDGEVVGGVEFFLDFSGELFGDLADDLVEEFVAGGFD